MADEPRVRTKRSHVSVGGPLPVYPSDPHFSGAWVPFPSYPGRPNPQKPQYPTRHTDAANYCNLGFPVGFPCYAPTRAPLFYGTQLLTPTLPNVTTTVSQGQKISISPTWSTPKRFFKTSFFPGRRVNLTHVIVLNEYFTPTDFFINEYFTATGWNTDWVSLYKNVPPPTNMLPGNLTLNATNGAITGSIDSSVTPGLYKLTVTVRLKTTARFGGMHTFTISTTNGYKATYQVQFLVTSRTSSSTSTTVTQGQT
ncbi:Ig domain-containing protein, partial [Tropheryma whipplei]|uniref:Ig domain-containing protein n=1 Tax=Tropheryma whipplei TaxID=2039 RepID=UPI002E2FABE2